MVGAVGGIVLLLACGFAWNRLQQRQHLADWIDLWSAADDSFDRGRYDEAAASYDALARTNEGEIPSNAPESWVALSASMASLCSAISKEEVASIAEAFEDLDEETELPVLRQDWKPMPIDQRFDEIRSWGQSKVDEFTSMRGTMIQGLPTDLSAAVEELPRWAELLTKQNQHSNLIDAWRPTLSSIGCQLNELQSFQLDLGTAIAQQTALIELVPRFDDAIGSLDRDKLEAIRTQWEDVQRQLGEQAPNTLYQDFQSRLVEQLRQGKLIQWTSMAGQTQWSIGTPPTPVPSEWLMMPSSAWANTVNEADSTEQKLTFVRAHEHCYALNVSDGTIRWVRPIGASSRWMPQSLDADWVLWPWVGEGGEEIISVVSARGDQTRWSKRLPLNVQLSGPPILVGERIVLGLRDGRIWSVAQADGELKNQWILPESLDGPITLAGTGQRALAVGKSGTLWRMDLSRGIRLLGATFDQGDPAITRRHALWIEPTIFVAEHRSGRQCRLNVWRSAAAGQWRESGNAVSADTTENYRRVQSIALGGRLWQPPQAAGTQLFCATDGFENSLWHVNLKTPVEPLTLRARWGRSIPYAIRPEAASHSDAPIVLMDQGRVECRRPNPLLDRDGQPPRVVWTHSLSSEDAVAVQPIDVHDDRLVVASQGPEARHIRVSALRVDDGQPLWTVNLGAGVTQAESQGETTLVCDDAGRGVVIGRNSAAKDASSDELSILPFPLLDGTHHWQAEPEVLVRWDRPTGELVASNFAGREYSSLPIASPPSSPMAIRLGKLGPQEPSKAQRPNIWVASVDEKSQLRVRGMDPRKLTEQPVPFPLKEQFANSSVEQTDLSSANQTNVSRSKMKLWHRPLWLNDSTLILASRDGRIRRVSANNSDGVIYFERSDTQHERMASPLSQPVRYAGQVWVTSADHVFALRDKDLTETWSQKMTSRASTTIHPFAGGLWVGTRDGHVLKLSVNGAEEIAATSIRHDTYRIGPHPIRFLFSIGQDRVGVIDSAAQGYHLATSGEVSEMPRSIPRLNVAPIWQGDQWRLATTSGLIRVVANGWFGNPDDSELASIRRMPK